MDKTKHSHHQHVGPDSDSVIMASIVLTGNMRIMIGV